MTVREIGQIQNGTFIIYIKDSIHLFWYYVNYDALTDAYIEWRQRNSQQGLTIINTLYYSIVYSFMQINSSFLVLYMRIV